MQSYPCKINSFHISVVNEFLSKYKEEWSQFQVIWPKVDTKYVYSIFAYNQNKWNNFKWILKRIRKGQLTELWLEEKSYPASLLLLKRVFQGTIVRNYEGHPVLEHKLKYYNK